jgi:cephalosporin hydroxylase
MHPACLSLRRSARIAPDQWETIDTFHRLWYESRLVGTTTWLGWHVLKTPLDLVRYQEIIVTTRPDWIIETGTAFGGSALFFASICDLIGHGRICTIDMTNDIPGLYRWVYGQDCQVPTERRPTHPRITYICGDVLNPAVRACVEGLVEGGVMVSLDSHHDAAHVQAELALWAPMVTPGNYLVIEDTNMGGHPVQEAPWDGPYEATETFLTTHPEFTIDTQIGERFLMSYNTWLVRAGEQESILW